MKALPGSQGCLQLAPVHSQMRPLNVPIMITDRVHDSDDMRALRDGPYSVTMAHLPSQAANPLLPPAGNLIYKGGGGEDLLIKAPPTIPELYLRTVASDPSSTFDQASFVPQVLSSPSNNCPCQSLAMPWMRDGWHRSLWYV